jgi:putative DNA-invertase from lambdoid prophage Rac
MKAVIYVRVSTQEQKLESQLDAIKKFCEYREHEILKIYSDKASGRDIERAGFTRMMKDLETNPLDAEVLIILKLDRIGRNLRDLLNIADELKRKKIEFISINDNLETNTSTGRLFFHIMGALAEHEREVILERTALGREYSLSRGVKFGRKPIKLDIAEIARKKSMGVSTRRLAKDYKVSRATIKNKLNDYYKAQSEPRGAVPNKKTQDKDQKLEEKKSETEDGSATRK